MWGLGRSLVKVRSAFADAYEMAELLDHESTEPINRGDAFVPKHYGIELKRVSFGYDAEQPILRNFSFSFEPGRSYGVIGKTGSGKSTLMKLVMKFYNADKGTITVGGRDIESIHKNTLRSLVSFVSQIPIFPSITIREVIALGNLSATEQEIISAAKQACCDFIWEKPLGLDTIIGERGIKLSGGEAQRLAIAAAILKNAPIVVMDEPTSALDAVTERAIQNALNSSFKGKTMIVIAHRLSTVAVLDEIILLEHGEIVDHGSHKKLLVSSQAYSEAWELQTNPQIFVHE
jgi:ATP-binding cassette subfamily B protein